MAMSDKTFEQVRAQSSARDNRGMRFGDVNAGFDLVVLDDGSLFAVQRNNLAAAKELLAAQNAVARRMKGLQ